MNQIAGQLVAAASALTNATHMVFTIGGNDLGVPNALVEVILKNNVTAVANKIASLKSQLIATYKQIQAVARPGTKIYAVPYVDFISVGGKISNEDNCHKIIDILSETIKEAAATVNIGFIEAVKGAFLGHEMFSADPYVDDFFDTKNAAHTNVKGYAKIGQVVAAYLSSS